MPAARKSTLSRPAQPEAKPEKTAALRAAAVLPVALMDDYLEVYRYPAEVRIALIRDGIPAKEVGRLAKDMKVPKDLLVESLGIQRAPLGRKERAAEALSPDESLRLLGVKSLIGQVQNMVGESGDPEGFDAAQWVGRWLGMPLPALGGRRPASYLATLEGQKLLAGLLATSQSGAYA